MNPRINFHFGTLSSRFRISHFNQLTAQKCKGDYMAIHLNPKQLSICKKRASGKCVVFIGYRSKSVLLRSSVIKVYFTGHSCSNWSSNSTKWANSDCEVSPTSHSTLTTCTCNTIQKATYSTNFFIPPKLLLSKISDGCWSCFHHILYCLFFRY